MRWPLGESEAFGWMLGCIDLGTKGRLALFDNSMEMKLYTFFAYGYTSSHVIIFMK